jgi:nucleotide-binding universal stress UspA family protein
LHLGSQITDEIKLLADQFDLKVEAQIASGSKPENAILTAPDRGDYDLLVMGVLFRPTE